LPQNRNWALGEKCEACERGGQPCGPNERHDERTPAFGERLANNLGVEPQSPTANVGASSVFSPNAEDEAYTPHILHQAGPLSNSASQVENGTIPGEFFGSFTSDDSAPMAQGGGWSSNIGEVLRADDNHFAQLLDHAGLTFDESGGSLMSSNGDFSPKRYEIRLLVIQLSDRFHILGWAFSHSSKILLDCIYRVAWMLCSSSHTRT
jgi:hypothetical protein